MDMAAGQALAGIVAAIGLIDDVDCRRHNRLGTTPLLQLVALSQLLQTKDRRPCDEAPDRRQATHRQCWRGHVQLAAGVVHLSSLSSFSCWKTSNAFRHNGLCTARLLQLVALLWLPMTTHQQRCDEEPSISQIMHRQRDRQRTPSARVETRAAGWHRAPVAAVMSSFSCRMMAANAVNAPTYHSCSWH